MAGVSIIAHSNVRDVLRTLENQQRQIPFAISLAINKTAQSVKRAEYDEMRRVFDRPTPFTLNSLFMAPSTKRKLEASVWLKGYADKGTAATTYIGPQIWGGERKLKRAERLLRRGHLAPGGAAKVDAYGNLSRGPLQRALAQVGVHFDPLTNATKVSRKRSKRRNASQFFVAEIGGTTALWERKGRRISPYLVAVRTPHYRPRLAFQAVAGREQSAVFLRELRSAVARAVATAR